MRHFLRYIMLFLFLFEGFAAMAQINTWRDIYEVKKKDTIYGIARMYELTVDELVEANPEMKGEKYKLKKGMKVFIPYKKQPVQEVKPVQKKMKTMPHQTLKVGIMLPLHDVDGDGKRMVEYYRGFLMGCDSLRRDGVSVDVHAWNVNIDADIRTTLLETGVKDLDLIVGPLYTKQVKYLADFCQQNQIKMVIPFSISAQDVQTNPQVYQVYQNGVQLNDRAIGAFMGRFADYNPVFIDCNDTTSQKGIFTFGLRKQLEAKGITPQITNLRSSEELFKKAFSTTKRNIVILNTGRSPELNLALRKLNELRLSAPEIQISLFGYTEWLSYEHTYRELFHRYDTYVPSTYYYYKGLTRVAQFESNYKKWYGLELQSQYIPRFALTGFDHAMFFLKGLYNEGSDFLGTEKDPAHRPLQTPLHFRRAAEGGGMQNAAFELIHYKEGQVIETLDY